MADRGRPIPFSIRQQIAAHVCERRISERRTARLLDISRNTVRKYRTKFEPPHARSA